MRTYRLGKEAAAYIRTCLSEGSVLANYLQDLPIEEGSITTCLPDSINPQALQQFDTGGIANSRHRREYLVTQIQEYLSGSDRRIAIFETLASPSDPSLSLYSSPFVVHGDQVYYVVTLQSSATEILDTVTFARAYPRIGILACLQTWHQRSQVGKELDENALRSIASECQHLFVGAYDDEAVLHWQRPKQGRGVGRPQPIHDTGVQGVV